MSLSRRIVFAGVAIATGFLGLGAEAANTSTPALPVTEVVTVQPIDVCGTTTGTTASCASLGSLSKYEQAVNAVWDQAGLGFAFLSPTRFTNSDYLDTTITINSNFPTGTPTDEAHTLMYGAGHGQNSNPTTLNVWFVNHLLTSTNTAVYGQGFIGGNGVVLPTFANPVTGRLPALDTLAHELGHNLGLTHVDGTTNASPLNQMQSSGRTVPSNPCQITPYTCTTSGTATDNLLSSQRNTARNPLFTVDLAHATVGLDFFEGSCVAGGTFCDFNVSFLPAATTQSLRAFKIRFLDSSAVLGASISGSGPTPSGSKTYTIPPTGAALEFDFASGVFVQGDTFNVEMNYFGTPTFSLPFSAEFDFSSGITSTALFDANGVADSQLPQHLGFIGTPTYGDGKVVPIVTETDLEQNPAATSANVSEPGGLAIVLTGIGILATVTRRKSGRDRGWKELPG